MVTTLVIAGLTGAMPIGVGAQSYPSKPVRLVVPLAPSGTGDIVARLVGEKLAQSLGQAVIIDNRPGAGSILGADLVAQATPDGYTILLGTAASHAINPSLHAKLPYDAIKSFSPVTLLAVQPLVLVVNPQIEVTSVKELIALAKARPGTLNFASAGNGTTLHLAGELFKEMAGIDIVHIAFRGSAAAFADLTTGRVHLAFDGLASVLPQVHAGKLRALAVTGVRRASVAPDVPTMQEAGLPGYEAMSWVGVFAPAGTPAAIVERLSRDIRAALDSSDVRRRFAELGQEPSGNRPEEFAAFQRAELEKWRTVIETAKLEKLQ